MKQLFSIIFLSIIGFTKPMAQNMDAEIMNKILTSMSDSITFQGGTWEFVIEDVFFICITDQVNNRMRIIAPIKEMKEVTIDQVNDAMEANFHSALDVRYAISESIMWAAFIHPFKELSTEQVYEAVSQVYSAALTFGTAYASTNLSFPRSVKDKAPTLQKY